MPHKCSKKWTFFILITIFIVNLNFVKAQGCGRDNEGNIIPCNYQSDDFYKKVDYSHPNIDWTKFDQSKVPIDRIKDIPADKVDVTKVQDKSKLTSDQLKFGDNLNKLKQWNQFNKDSLNKALSDRTGRDVVIQNPENGHVTENGFSVDAKLVRIDETSVTNCIKCVYDGIKLRFEHADSVTTDKSVSTNVDNFDGYKDSFKIEKADSLLSGCLRFDKIKDSSFLIFDSKVTANIKNESNVTVTDCSYTESEFESKGNGSITVNKDSKPKYEVKEGILKCKYGVNVDKIEAQNVANVDIDNCFSCLTITPVGSYFYNDKDLRKDFVINIPKESPTYKLCLRKNIAQNFQVYNGLVDFINKKIELNGIVNYLRYPFKNNQISSLLSNFVYQGLQNVNAILSYDNNLIFLNNIFIKNKNNLKKDTLSITYPNNYYTIKEVEIDNEIHSIVELNLNLKKEDLTQNINYEYKTDYFGLKVSIKDNIFIQDNGKNRITILPVGHENINKIIENVKEQ